MEIKTSNKYVISFRDLKEKFPEIKGDLIEMTFDEKNRSLIVDTTSACFEDSKVIIHKEYTTIVKEVFRIKDKETNIIAEGASEKEARDKLQELMVAPKEGTQNGQKDKNG